ncbi:MAG: rhodanese-like domain-containing protein [Gordonibacter sp.]|uniref:rhodanese-like domain-containing protein n=1 Tax=Gordonibacter sp. TaxID=1968902 RepID=UPI002FC6FCFF
MIMSVQVRRSIKVRALLALFAAALVLLSACSASNQGNAADTKEGAVTGAYQKMSPAEAKAVMEGGGPFIVLDVRSADEFAQGHIPGAVLIPDNELAARAEAELPSKDETILVYCRSGRRSAAAAEMLAGRGYTQVFDFGGIADWPYETVTD